EVLFSGQDQLSGLISQAPTWSLGALALLIVFKGIAYAISLGSFRGGPTFPALFLGAAAGLMASHLPNLPGSAGGVGWIGAAGVSTRRLPLSAIVTATVLSTKAGSSVEPLVIVGVVVALLATLGLARSRAAVFGSERPVTPTEKPQAQTTTADSSPATPPPA